MRAGVSENVGKMLIEPNMTDAQLIAKCQDLLMHSSRHRFNLLNPKNMYIIFVSKNAINADDLCEASEEKWYGTKYMDYSMKNIEEWASPSRENKDLYMPEPNRFVASDLSIRDVRSVRA